MKNQKNILTGFISSLLLFCSTLPAFADTYVGVGAGYYSVDDEDFLDEDNDLRDNRSAWKAFIGGTIGDIFGLEVGHVDFGDSQDGPLTFEAEGHTLAATLGIPLGEGARLYGKAGKLFWDADAGIDNTTLASTDDEDTFYGAGIRFGASPGVGLKVEYERYKLGDTDIDMPSVNLNLSF